MSNKFNIYLSETNNLSLNVQSIFPDEIKKTENEIYGFNIVLQIANGLNINVCNFHVQQNNTGSYILGIQTGISIINNIVVTEIDLVNGIDIKFT